MLGYLSRLFPTRSVPRNEGPQTERLLRWIVVAILLGAVAILLGALAGADRAHPLAPLRFVSVGLLAALLAFIVGGAFGLLFGLPVGGKVVVVAPANGAAGDKADKPGGDWFGDNNAMEQIVDWLTKIIVGLGLIQAHAIAQQFDRIATAVTLAMGAPTTSSTDGDEVIGGVILVAYLLLGFVGLFLWARRYLKCEWTQERVERVDLERQAREEKLLERSDAANTHQNRKSGAEQDLAIASVTAAAAPGGQPDGFPAPVQPGTVKDDPWAGQFGGKATQGNAVLDATVLPLQTRPGWYGISLTLHGADAAARQALDGTSARLYLHPTFPDPIRLLIFDTVGEIKLPLSAYGSFTVGAQLADGRLLELDLAKLEGVTAEFRDN